MVNTAWAGHVLKEGGGRYLADWRGMNSGIAGGPCKSQLGFIDPACSSNDEEEGQLRLPLSSGWLTYFIGPLCVPYLVSKCLLRVF